MPAGRRFEGIPRIGAGTLAYARSDFPLRVSANGRYVTRQDGTPIRIKADAGWFIPTHLGVSDQNAYLDYIVTKGYNATICMAVVQHGGGGWPEVNEPNDADGVAPFTTVNDFSTRNDVYFNKIADYISRAKARGIAVMLFFLYQGYQGGLQGWESAMTGNSDANCTAFGQYLGNKFPHANIVWMLCGDTIISGTALSKFQLVWAGIQSVARNRLAGSELSAPNALVTDQTGFTYGIDPATSDMQIASFYACGTSPSVPFNGRSYDTALASWDLATKMPAMAEEPLYEGNTFGVEGRQYERRMAQWCATSACHSWNTGINGRWQAVPIGSESSSGVGLNYSSHFNGSVDNDNQNAFRFYESLHWELLVPSGTAAGRCGRDLIVSTNTQDDTFITSSLASDSSFMVIYLPPGSSNRTFQVDFRGMSGTSTVYRVDPTNWASVADQTSLGTFANSLSAQSFTTPVGNNAGGDSDWIYLAKVPS